MADKYAPDDATTPEWAAPGSAPVGPAPRKRPASGSSAPASKPASPAQDVRAAARSWRPGIIALRPLTFGDIIGAPFKAMQFNRAAILGGPFVASLVSAITSAVFLYLFLRDLSLSFWELKIGTNTWVMGAVAIVVALFADIFARSIVAPGVARAILGEKPSLRELLGLVRPRLLGVTGLYFIFLGVMIVISLVIGLLAAFGGSASGLAIVLVLAAIPLTAMVYARYAVATAALVLERTKVRTALSRSRELLNTKAWWTVGVGVVVFLVLIGFAIATQVLSSLVESVTTGNTNDLDTYLLVSTIATAVIQVIQQTIQFAFVGGAYTFVYVDRRIRVEGFDLDLQEAVEARAA